MRSTDTYCKTCGAEYKNNPIILLFILILVVGLLIFIGFYYFQIKQKNNDVHPQNSKKNQTTEKLITDWFIEENIDKMSDKKNYYLSIKAINADTRLRSDAGITIGCASDGSLIGVFAADVPIKIKDFKKEGAIGEYSIRIDDKTAMTKRSQLSSINSVVELDENIINQIENSSKILVRIVTTTDAYRTYEMNSSNGKKMFTKINELCVNNAKQGKAN
ncbi:hypothetical protein KTI59_07545 [Acinetobacter radioresistens]|uniref:hypothetical protein n=1 Tax=Acinetobacter radioresistens TaxID=40216 RepID=UPI0012BB109F|nr:hypothetical protein [Acinetobacter radioresistens]MCU4499968.1 hypothetical protein [Acinetobacter radioresistens]